MSIPTSFRSVVALWASCEALAADIGAPATAVRKWSQRDRIPADWWVPIVESEIGKANGVTVEILARLIREPAAEPLEARP
jgi:hypothetical protein